MRKVFRPAVTAVVTVVIAGLLALVLLLATGVVGPFGGLLGFSTRSESRSTQIISAVERQEQVVLLSLGIQGLEERTDTTEFLGLASERTALLRYEFNAKLGIDGGGVDIVETAENAFSITIPEFQFIGHEFVSEDGEPFKVYELGNALSWMTPEIEESELINQVLSSDHQAEYVGEHREQLEAQTKVFYEGIIRAVAPDATLEFHFL